MQGICFMKSMFELVLTGQKTQTRRIICPQPKGQLFDSIHYTKGNILKEKFDFDCGLSATPKYNVGEKVYLKEPYAETCDEYGSPLIAYRFDNTALYLVRKDGNGDYYQLNTVKKPVTTNWTINNFPACGEWKNKLFMPEWAARYFIEITAVRAEKLFDMPENDCMKEGIILNPYNMGGGNYYYTYYHSKWGEGSWFRNFLTARDAYASLIDHINGKGTWNSNFYVWVYDFKLVKK